MNVFRFGKGSKINLQSADVRLYKLFKMVLSLGLIDVSITEGHRNKITQNAYYDTAQSKVTWPNSKHNSYPSLAIDAVPYVNGKSSYDYKHCIYLAGIVMACASALDIKVRWGGNWDMDTEIMTDQDFQDLLHYEVVR